MAYKRPQRSGVGEKEGYLHPLNMPKNCTVLHHSGSLVHQSVAVCDSALVYDWLCESAFC